MEFIRTFHRLLKVGLINIYEDGISQGRSLNYIMTNSGLDVVLIAEGMPRAQTLTLMSHENDNTEYIHS